MRRSREGTIVMIHHVAQFSTTWNLPKVMAWDNVDGNLTAAVSMFGAAAINLNVATAPEQPYVVTYRVADAAGNAAPITRRRIYVANPCASNSADGTVEFLCSDGFCSTAGLCVGATDFETVLDTEAVELVNEQPTITLVVRSCHVCSTAEGEHGLDGVGVDGLSAMRGF